jgi:hypothetical protein
MITINSADAELITTELYWTTSSRLSLNYRVQGQELVRVSTSDDGQANEGKQELELDD